MLRSRKRSRYLKPRGVSGTSHKLRSWHPAVAHARRIRWHPAAKLGAIRRRFHGAAQLEYAALGGWKAFRNGEWLWLLIQKSIINCWERATVEPLLAMRGTADPEAIAAKLIAGAAKDSAVLGAVTAATISTDEIIAILGVAEGGGLGLPVNLAIAASAISAEAILLVGFQLQLIANLGNLYGVTLHPDEPGDILTILAFAIGGAAAEAADRAGMRIGSQTARPVAEIFLRTDVHALFERIGVKLGIKIFQRAILKYVNPLSAIGIGTGWNYIATKRVGEIAVQHFRKRVATPCAE